MKAFQCFQKLKKKKKNATNHALLENLLPIKLSHNNQRLILKIYN